MVVIKEVGQGPFEEYVSKVPRKFPIPEFVVGTMPETTFMVFMRKDVNDMCLSAFKGTGVLFMFLMSLGVAAYAIKGFWVGFGQSITLIGAFLGTIVVMITLVIWKVSSKRRARAPEVEQKSK